MASLIFFLAVQLIQADGAFTVNGHTHTPTHTYTHTREHYFADLVQIQGKFFLQSVKVNNATLRSLIAERNELQGSYFF